MNDVVAGEGRAAAPEEQLPLARAELGSLFVVPERDWTAVSQRVGRVERLRGVADSVTRYLPAFGPLVTASIRWRASTFPDIVASSSALRDYCRQAVDSYSVVQTALTPDPLAPPVQVSVRDALAALADRTRVMSDRFATLSATIRDFNEVNRGVDAEVGSFARRLGPDWQSIVPSTTAVDDATGRVRGAWGALNDDLHALRVQPVDVTAPFVARLQIGAALAAWRNLQAAAEDFAQVAADQSAYLSGAWLGEVRA